MDDNSKTINIIGFAYCCVYTHTRTHTRTRKYTHARARAHTHASMEGGFVTEGMKRGNK